MKIAYIAAGAAGMYCGSCIHDNTLAAALLKKGTDVVLIPTYTPLRTDETDVSMGRIFYGGINVYLQQKLPVFRHTPRFIDRIFDHPSLLNWLSRFSSSTNAADLGALTVSVLKGEEGYQKKELDKLTVWLKQVYQPDIVQLTNTMFAGFARQIKQALGVPVLCAAQGEDLFLDDLVAPYKSQAMGLLHERTQDIDGFIVPCRYYAEYMAGYLRIPIAKMHVVNLGINLQGYGEANGHLELTPFTIGYLARICPEKGLHLLIEAFHLLAEQMERGQARLRIAGYLGRGDQAYFRKIMAQVESWGLANLVEYVGEVDRAHKTRFLNSLHLLSVPTVYREPKGLPVLEALANAVPVVLPRHGAFPELIEATGGGILVDAESPPAIAEGILQLMNDSERRQELGNRGKAAVHRSFSDETMAEATLEVYRKYLD